MDNFEWDMGHEPRFGLYTSDRTDKRWWAVYASIIKAARAGNLAQPTSDAVIAAPAGIPRLLKSKTIGGTGDCPPPFFSINFFSCVSTKSQLSICN